MKIVLLDSATLGDDLDLSPLSKYGEVVSYPSTAPELVKERLEGADIPKNLQGLPITLVSASLVSMSFLGFTGLVENIFN